MANKSYKSGTISQGIYECKDNRKHILFVLFIVLFYDVLNLKT